MAATELDSLGWTLAVQDVYGGCHGADARAVFSELCDIVEDSVDLYERDGRPLPEPMSGRGFVNALNRKP
jgi:hypothetical protein